LRERRAIYTCSACDGMKTWSIGAREQLPRSHAMGDKTRGNISVNSNSSFSIVWDDGLHLHVRCFVHFLLGGLFLLFFFYIVSSMSPHCSVELGDYVFLVGWLSVNIALQSMFII
jgi:hypothetical protein